MGEIEFLTPKYAGLVAIKPCPHKVKVRTDVITYGGTTLLLGSDLCLSCEFCVNKQHKLADGKVLCGYLAEMRRRKEEK